MDSNVSSFDVNLTGDFRFGDEIIFRDLKFSLLAKQWTCLIGLSGAGKSTLLRLIAGLETGGEFNGLVSANDNKPISNRVAYMAQSDLLFPWLTVGENISLGHRLRGQSLDHERLDNLIESVGLAEHIDKKPPALSGGMRQRTALARTLLEDTPVVLLDEPFSALDARTRSSMQELAFVLLSDRTVLLVTHDPAEAVRLGHRLFEVSSHGLKQHQLPESKPIRAINDAEALARQAELLLTLRA